MLIRKCDVCNSEILAGDFWDVVARYISYTQNGEDRGKEIRIEVCRNCMKNNEFYKFAKKGDM